MTASSLLDRPGPAHPDQDDLAQDHSSVPGLDETDDRLFRPDPADGVVAIGEVPPVVRPAKSPGRSPGRSRFRSVDLPTDRPAAGSSPCCSPRSARSSGFWDIGGAVDGGTGVGVPTPLFDEKYYAVQAAEVIRNLGVEDNQGFAVVVHPPLGKQLIAIGETAARLQPGRLALLLGDRRHPDRSS